MNNREICIKLLRIEKSIKTYRNKVCNIDHVLTIDIIDDARENGMYSKRYSEFHKKCIDFDESCDKILSQFNGIKIDTYSLQRFDEYRTNLRLEFDEIEKEFNIISNDFHRYKLKRLNNGEIR